MSSRAGASPSPGFAPAGALLAGALLMASLPCSASIRAAEGAAVDNAAVASAALLGALRSITSDELQTEAEKLADDIFEGREAGSRGGRAAGNYLIQYMHQHGLKPAGEDGRFEQTFEGSSRNLLGLLEGSDPRLRDQVIVVGAHYDHVGYGSKKNSFGPVGYIHNGADDNASGVAGVMEVIEAFRTLPQAPRRGVLFAFWDGEEKGLNGSKHWMANPTLPLERVRFMLNLDMIGRLRDGQVEVHGGRTSWGLRKLLAEQNQPFGLALDHKWEMKAISDHYSFFEKRIPAVMLHTGLHDNYHRPSDDAHLLNADGMRQVAQLAFATAWELADGSREFTFRQQSTGDTPSAQKAFEQPDPPLEPRLGASWQAELPARGVRIVIVNRGSPAERAGLRVGDRLLACDGEKIVDDQALIQRILLAAAPLSFEREAADGARDLVRVTLAGPPIRVGLSWRDDAAEPGCVLVSQVARHSPAAKAGVVPGDRLYEVNGHAYRNGEELRQLLATTPGPLELLVERKGRLARLRLEVAPPPPGG